MAVSLKDTLEPSNYTSWKQRGEKCVPRIAATYQEYQLVWNCPCDAVYQRITADL